MKESSLIKVSTNLPTHLVELVEGYLHETFPTSWYINEDKLSNQTTLVGFFSNANELECAKSALYQEIPSSLIGDFSHDEIRDEDWKNSYKNILNLGYTKGFILSLLGLRKIL